MDFIKIIKKSTYEDLQNKIVMLQAENRVLMDKVNGNESHTRLILNIKKRQDNC